MPQECIERAAEKHGQTLSRTSSLSTTSAQRLALGSIVVPAASDLDADVMRRLPPAMQFEVLEEIKLSERARRRDLLVNAAHEGQHTMSTFSHQQLANYIEVSKVAAQVNELRAELASNADHSRRIASDATRQYYLYDAAELDDETEGQCRDPVAARRKALEDMKRKREEQAAKREEQATRHLAMQIAPSAGDAGPSQGVEVDDQGGGGFFPEEDGDGCGFFPEEDGSGGFVPEGCDAAGPLSEEHGNGASFPYQSASSKQPIRSASKAVEGDVEDEEDEEAELARAIALSYESHSAASRRAGKQKATSDTPMDHSASQRSLGAPSSSAGKGSAGPSWFALSDSEAEDADLAMSVRAAQADGKLPLPQDASGSPSSAAPSGPMPPAHSKDADMEVILSDEEVSFELLGEDEDADDDLFTSDFIKQCEEKRRQRLQISHTASGEELFEGRKEPTAPAEGNSGDGSITQFEMRQGREPLNSANNPVDLTENSLPSQSKKFETESSDGMATAMEASVVNSHLNASDPAVTTGRAPEGGAAWRMHAKSRMWNTMKTGDRYAGHGHPLSTDLDNESLAGNGSLPEVGDGNYKGLSTATVAQASDQINKTTDHPGRNFDSQDADHESREPNESDCAEVMNSSGCNVDEAGEDGAEAGELQCLGDAISEGCNDTRSHYSQTENREHSANEADGHNDREELEPDPQDDARASSKVDQRESIAAKRVAMEAELDEVQREADSLHQAQKKLARDAEQVSDETYTEAKRLLGLFGVPYVEAPFEAEAQCAQLERAGIVDGIATEDNDVFLFGGRNVYKHLFDQKHHIEVYSMEDVESELQLSRRELVYMAQLLGSDYTDGVHGVGIVNAMETIAAYGPSDEGLTKFARWVRAWRGAADGTAANGDSEGDDTSSEEAESLLPEIEGEETRRQVGESREQRARRRVFNKRHRTVRRNWVLPESFPLAAVSQAYLQPSVDQSEIPCQWARPNLRALREFCLDKFSWPQAKADELLLPMMAEIEKGMTQTRIDSHFTFEKRFARVDSSRLATAIGLKTGEDHLSVPTTYIAGLAAKRKGGKHGAKAHSVRAKQKRKNGEDAGALTYESAMNSAKRSGAPRDAKAAGKRKVEAESSMDNIGVHVGRDNGESLTTISRSMPVLQTTANTPENMCSSSAELNALTQAMHPASGGDLLAPIPYRASGSARDVSKNRSSAAPNPRANRRKAPAEAEAANAAAAHERATARHASAIARVQEASARAVAARDKYAELVAQQSSAKGVSTAQASSRPATLSGARIDALQEEPDQPEMNPQGTVDESIISGGKQPATKLSETLSASQSSRMALGDALKATPADQKQSLGDALRMAVTQL